jgi:P-type E1-E2 ATPase
LYQDEYFTSVERSGCQGSVGLRFSLLDRQILTKPGRYVPSSELVPGDVYEVTDPALTQFPCDSILLAGDCIVNESMLTGKNSHIMRICN